MRRSFYFFLLLCLSSGLLHAATITVTSTADSGAGTLRAGIAAAAAGDTIDFSASLTGQSIVLTSGEISIDKALTISGPGAQNLTVNGGFSSRIFNVTALAATVSISGLTLAHGNSGASSGGAMEL